MEVSAVAADVRALIKNYMRGFFDSPFNRIAGSGEAVYENFLLGAAAGGDPIFERFKMEDACGPAQMTPLELFTKAKPEEKVSAEELSVVCWVLPQTEAARLSNRDMRELPSVRWGAAKELGERFYGAMGLGLERYLQQNGVSAIYPMGHPEIVAHFADDRFYIANNWSERHACHAAGLGTFGLCDALITPAGKAYRCGSIVIRAQVKATPREYSGLHDYCPFFRNGSCGLCIKRCPAGAISAAGHDKRKCGELLKGEASRFLAEHGVNTDACGLCQTGVPCEDRIPGRAPAKVLRDFI